MSTTAVAFAIALGQTPAQPAAMAVRAWGGAVTIRGKEVHAGFSLAEGSEVELRSGARLTLVTMGDMTRWDCRGASVFRVKRNGLVPVSGAKPVRQQALVVGPRGRRTPPRPSMGGVGGTLLRGPEEWRPRDLRPVGVVRTPKVTLQWTPPRLGQDVRLRLKWNGGSHSVDLKRTTSSYEVPEGVIPKGVPVQWSLTTFKDGISEGGAESWILVAAPEALTFVEAWDAFQPRDAEERIVRGLVYEQAGFLTDALRELTGAAGEGAKGLEEVIARVRLAIEGEKP